MHDPVKEKVHSDGVCHVLYVQCLKRKWVVGQSYEWIYVAQVVTVDHIHEACA